jgi:hypothetical protein
MRKILVTFISALATATLLTITASSAATYTFNFQSSDAELTATGQFTVNSANEVTFVSGAVAGLTNQAISGVTANPSFPTSSTSPDGLFIFDNLYSPPARPSTTAGCCSPRRTIRAATGICGRVRQAHIRSTSRRTAPTRLRKAER